MSLTAMPSTDASVETSSHTFVIPVKKINEGIDVSHFLTSKAYSEIMTFLLQLNRAMFPRLAPATETGYLDFPSDMKLSSSPLISGPVRSLQELLGTLNNIIDEEPPDMGPRRFGNVSFRKWYKKVEERAPNLLHSYLPRPTVGTASEVQIQDEIMPYFLGSFGSAQRLDYGSGHELSFLAFLGCVWKFGGFGHPPETLIETSTKENSQDEQFRHIVLGVLQDYFRLIRRLIKTYTLEPAGSHGVWGLDDHSFLPYIFGSAQYGPPISETDETPIEGSLDGAPEPTEVAKMSAMRRYRESNLYFDAIGFIHDVKTGPFWEHSPMLYDISGVKGGWGKINKGMIKMYSAEVLSKFPVVQHFPFGSAFSWETDPNAPPPPASIHASSQPFSLDSSAKSSGAEKVAPARPVPQEGTQATWERRPNAPIPPFQPAGVSMPRATGLPLSPAARPGTENPTKFPVPVRDVRRQATLSTADVEPSQGSMPAPTRAPWAKGP